MYEKLNSTQLKDNYGFTLVELSIVLVIIGLLVGGVLQGRELIEASKRQSVISDITKYQTALNTFKLQYNGALPGDFDEAEDYWGSVSGSCLTDAGTGTQTCNGDGDGKIDYIYSSHDDTNHEGWRVWQHLALSEMIEGSYTGISATGCSVVNLCSAPGINAPESAYSGASWNLFHLNSTVTWRGKNETRHVIALGNINNPIYNGQFTWSGGALTTRTQKSIDDKIDDGMPHTGVITDQNASHTPDCSDDSVSAEYKLTNSGIACVLFVDMD